MSNSDIEETIESHIRAGRYAFNAGADGVQLHCSHGFLLCDFLSPASNMRTDKWGNSPDNRTRIVREIAGGIRKATSESFSVSVKLNSDDHVTHGVTPKLAVEYIHLLKDMIDFFEISNGMNRGRFWSIRFNVQKEWIDSLPVEIRAEALKKGADFGIPYHNQYNFPDTEFIRAAHPTVKLATVGGHRILSEMENIVNKGTADLISLSRPLIRDPHFIRKLREGAVTRSSCRNCGGCLILYGKDGVRCHWQD
jgi:2,4-dienoyl-CoA reductase-like NADH-dependent reductase (Old Yellow Enzyme family)